MTSRMTDLRVYKITNTTNSRVYIGVTKHEAQVRFCQHALGFGNKPLAISIRSSEPNVFTMESTQLMPSKDAFYIEKALITSYDFQKLTFNENRGTFKKMEEDTEVHYQELQPVDLSCAWSFLTSNPFSGFISVHQFFNIPTSGSPFPRQLPPSAVHARIFYNHVKKTHFPDGVNVPTFEDYESWAVPFEETIWAFIQDKAFGSQANYISQFASIFSYLKNEPLYLKYTAHKREIDQQKELQTISSLPIPVWAKPPSKKPLEIQMSDKYVEILKNVQDLSDGSKKTYLSCLTMLQRDLIKHGYNRPDVEWIVTHPKDVIKLIFSVYPNIHTKHNMVTMIKTLFRHAGDLMERRPDDFKAWGDVVSSLATMKQEQGLSGQMTAKEQEGWVDWKDVLAKEKHLAQTEYGSFDHLMLAMYCLIPPLRQNFGNVKIYHAMPSTDGIKENLVVITPTGKGTLVLTDYKTSKRYGNFVEELPDDLVRIIQASLAANPRTHLFVKYDGEPYILQNSFTVTSNRTFKRLFGKPVTVSILRHSCISATDFNASTPQELFDKAKNMTHSLGMQQMYRKRVPAEKVPEVPVEETLPVRTKPRTGERIVIVRI
jgi:predicted GIY-YIG superfamily endonuclease